MTSPRSGDRDKRDSPRSGDCDDMTRFVELCRILVERDGQRLYRAVNSPAIIGIENPHIGKLWIKRVRRRLMITLHFHKDAARTCVYDNGQAGDDEVVGEWGCWLNYYRDEIERRLVLDRLAMI